MIPRTGNLVRVRNRRAVVGSVSPFPSANDELLHLVRVDYNDHDGSQAEEDLIWERECSASILQSDSLPAVDNLEPLPPASFDAYVRAMRWSSLQPYLDFDHEVEIKGAEPLASPFHGAIQPEDYQLLPLLKAMTMPRISLMISDDVGLGKTIEAGMIIAELVLRRRIRKILVICPASLRDQWKEEMDEKFAIHFDIVDRDSTAKMRREIGLEANPWRTFPNIITSYHYLKQPDVWEDFRAASTQAPGNPRLEWDLLIVDEVHNLTPAPVGQESDLSKMLGNLAPLFEHKVFLTATPHNGHTASFTGLLERLDPVRFSRTSEMSDLMKERAEEVNIRRLKSEINEVTDPPKFCTRHPGSIVLDLSTEEISLSEAFQDLRAGIKEAIREERRQKRRAGAFAVEILGKRLLSCPYAFAESWLRFRKGIEEEAEEITERDVQLAERSVREETGDDKETAARERQASQTVGGWLKPFRETLSAEISAIDAALERLCLLDLEHEPDRPHDPDSDARFTAIIDWIEEKLRDGDGWKDDERVIIFTEYKTTLDYLSRRLLDRYGEDGSLLELFGNMSRAERRQVKTLFNDPSSTVRILLATDAASEGLNLQKTTRYLIHYDIPWNPARMEQRNGRIDRHGQARDVHVLHFESDDDADLAFLKKIADRVQQIRDDLTSAGEVFDRAFERRLIYGEDPDAVLEDVMAGTEAAKARAEIPRDAQAETSEQQREDGQADLDLLARELDYTAAAMRETLEAALSINHPHDVFEDTGDERVRFASSPPVTWSDAIDAIRLSTTGQRGAIPALAFDPEVFIETASNGRRVFRDLPDTRLLHLADPLFHECFSVFSRVRFQAGQHPCRWTVRHGDLRTDGAEALVLLTVEELAVNELRETFHHWVRTLVFPVVGGELGEPLPHLPAGDSELDEQVEPGALRDRAIDLWLEVDQALAEKLESWRGEVNNRLSTLLAVDLEEAKAREAELYQRRQGEISKLIEENKISKLEREIETMQRRIIQQELFDEENRVEELSRSIESKEEEIKRRRAHYESVQKVLSADRERILNHLIPKRHALAGEAQVVPVAIEIRFPQS